MTKPQIDPDLMPKIHAICAGETDHVTLMAVVAAQLETLLAELFSRD